MQKPLPKPRARCSPQERLGSGKGSFGAELFWEEVSVGVKVGKQGAGAELAKANAGGSTVCGPGESPDSRGFGVGGLAKTAGGWGERSLLPRPDSSCVT